MDKYKDSLLATVTHDLKTPLNGIISYAQISEYCLFQRQFSEIGNNL